MGNVKPFVPYGTLLSGDNEKLKGVVEEIKEGISKVDKIVNEEIEKLTKTIEESKVSAAAFEEFVQKQAFPYQQSQQLNCYQLSLLYRLSC